MDRIRRETGSRIRETAAPRPVRESPRPSDTGTPAAPAKPSFFRPAEEITVYREKHGMDIPFLIIVLILLCLGSVMIFSASYVFAESRYHDSFFFIKKQAVFAAAGVVVAFAVSHIDYTFIKKLTLPVFAASYLLLLAVPFLGSSAKGATRWIYIGPISVQPSEIMKFSLVLMLAYYFSIYAKRAKEFRYGILYPALLIGVVCGTTILERHMSGTIILFLIGAVMILISGASLRWLAAIGGSFGAVALSIILFTDYAKSRVDAWLHPENDLLGDGWQPYQSLLAIGSGGLFGVGLGNSYQKHLWLPEPQNDFIYSIVCEELGLLGALAVLGLFVALIWRGFTIAMDAPDTFSSLLVLGLTAKIGIQALLNIAVVTVSIPTTGIALPFFSYGGSALIMQMAEVGVILSVSQYSTRKTV